MSDVMQHAEMRNWWGTSFSMSLAVAGIQRPSGMHRTTVIPLAATWKGKTCNKEKGNKVLLVPSEKLSTAPSTVIESTSLC